MPAIAYRRIIKRRRRRRLVPRKRIFKVRSLIPRRTIYIHKGRFILFKQRKQRARIFRRFNLYVIPKIQTKYTPKKKPSQKSISKKRIEKDWSAEKKAVAKVWKTKGYKELYKPKDTGGFPPSLVSWAKESYAREKLKTRKKMLLAVLEKAFKKIERRGGKREYEWKGKYYGRMKALGPKLIFEVFPTTEYFMFIRARKNYGDHKAIVKQIRKIMQKVIDDLIDYAEIVINKYVPEETGDLRKAMIDSIKKSKVRGLTIKVELDTGNIKYANPVNNMPESKIRHNMKTKQTGRRSGKYLDDPKAVEGWWQFITMQLNKEAGKLLRVMIIDIMTAFTFRHFKKIPRLKPRSSGKAHRTYVLSTTEKQLHTFWTKDEVAAYYNKAYNRKGKNKEEEYYFDYEYKTVKVKKEFKIPIDRPMIEDLEMEKHVRMVEYWQDVNKAMKESKLIEYPRDLVRGMFKIRGLYKGNKVY